MVCAVCGECTGYGASCVSSGRPGNQNQFNCGLNSTNLWGLFNYLWMDLVRYFLMGQTWPLFNYFRPFQILCKYCFNLDNINWKSVDFMLRIRTQGRRMEVVDETTELWRPPHVRYWIAKFPSFIDFKLEMVLVISFHFIIYTFQINADTCSE